MSQTIRILVVDDDPAFLQFLSSLLRTQGYEVQEAATARQGLQLTREKPPDLALLDVLLPDLSGLEVCRQIKADATLQDMFVVLISGGDGSATQKVDGLASGADDYITRPVDPAEFLARIRTMLRLRSAITALRASEQLHQRFTESLPEAAILTDLQGRILLVNPAALTLLGLAEPADVLQRSVVDFAPPQEHDRIRSHLARLLDSSSVCNEEFTLVRKGGDRIPIELSTAAWKDAHGQVCGFSSVVRDISSRKQSERTIRESEQRFRELTESIREVFWITNPAKDRMLYVSPAYEAIWGRSCRSLYEAPRAWIEAIHPEDRERVRAAALTRQATNQYEEVYRIVRPDGSQRWIQDRAYAVRDESGEACRIVGVARDITERRQAENQSAAFTLLGQQLSAAMDAGAAAQIILEVASGLFGWDAAYVDLYSPAEDRIMPILTMDTLAGERRMFPPASQEHEPSPLMRQVMAEGARLTNRDEDSPPKAAWHPFGFLQQYSESMMHAPIHSGGDTIGILSIQSYRPRAYGPADLNLLQTLADHCGDALQRIKMTEALRETEAKYRNIVENAVEGIFQSTPAGRYLSVNPALARMLGYEMPQEVVAGITDIARQVFVRPERREEFKRAVESQGAVEGFESEHRRKDGSRFWMSVNARVVRDSAGQVLYYEGMALDTTERKWAEQLRQTQRDFGIFLSSCSELKAAAEHLLAIALHQEGIDCGAVYLVDARTNALELMAHEGLSAAFARWANPAVEPAGWKSAPPPDTSMTGLVAQLEHEGLRTRELLPIEHKGCVVAVLIVGSRVHAEIPANSLQAIDTIAALAGGAIARIHAEDSLRKHQQLLEKTLSGLRAAVFILEAEPVIIRECNPAATTIFGYARNEVIGRSPVLLHQDEAMHDQFRAHLLAAVKSHGFLEGFEYPMKRKNGTLFPTEHHVMPIKDGTGLVINWVSVVRDLTEVKRTEEELRTVSRQIIEAQEAERQRVARELHDGVNQIIASAKMRLRSVEENVGAQNPAARLILGRCARLLVQALEENRRIAHDLRPTDLDQLGLTSACRNFCKEFQARSGLTVKCQIGRQIQRLPAAVELNFFRIIQESLTNVERHARARSVRLRLAVQEERLVLRIQDDGCGFHPGRLRACKGKRPGLGLTNILERAASLAGSCEVKSAPKRGTTITISVPIKPAD
jgi:PAS domain S-box-containing protein